jgi:hypothetical protein
LHDNFGYPTLNYFQRDYPERGNESDVDLLTLLKDGYFLIGHGDSTEYFQRILQNDTSFRVLIGVRDLRDVLVSQVYFQWTLLEELLGPCDFEKKLDFLLENNDIFLHPRLFVISRHAEAILALKSHPRSYVVRFENLVGEEGGGNKCLQTITMHEIAKHLNLEISFRQLDPIQRILFGDSGTFREGKIGTWREKFTRVQLDYFNQKFGELQRALGYTLN